jgi:hypothetical protein
MLAIARVRRQVLSAGMLMELLWQGKSEISSGCCHEMAAACNWGTTFTAATLGLLWLDVNL